MTRHRKRRPLITKPFDLDLFFGLRKGVKLCCVLFFESIWDTKWRADPDLNSSWLQEDFSGYDTSRITYENGILLCPECIVSQMKKTCPAHGRWKDK